MGYSLIITYWNDSKNPPLVTWHKSFIKIFIRAWVESWKPKTHSIEIDRLSQTKYIFERY